MQPTLKLTPRQQQAVDLKAQGHRARKIAELMGGISVRTVDKFLFDARQKIRDQRELQP